MANTVIAVSPVVPVPPSAATRPSGVWKYWSSRHLFTAWTAAAGILLLAYVPQINHIVLQLPLPWKTQGAEIAMAVALRFFVLLLLTCYVLAAVVVVPRTRRPLRGQNGPAPSRPDCSGCPHEPPTWFYWCETCLGQRLGRMTAAAVLVSAGAWYVCPLGLEDTGWSYAVLGVFVGVLGLVVTFRSSDADERGLTERTSGWRRLAQAPSQLPDWLWHAARKMNPTVRLGIGAVVVILGVLWIILWNDGRAWAFGVLLILTGAWLGGTSGDVLPSRVRWSFGRALGMLLIANAVGEFLWELPNWAEWASPRNYAIWAMLNLLGSLLLLARVFDVAHVDTPWPVRQLVLLALVMLVLIFMGPAPVGEVGPDAPAASDSAVLARREFQLAQQWFAYLEKKLTTLPEDGPVLLVAASGGGSRAAMFTALVYEGLTHMEAPRRPGRAAYHMADYVLVISSVSGGSLATAYQVQRPENPPAPWRHAFGSELESSLPLIAKQFAATDDWESDLDRKVFETKARNCVDPKRAGKPGDIETWLMTSPFVDGMGTNFMAPLLRGALLPRLERGTAVTQFWEHQFGWRGSNNMQGYRAAGWDVKHVQGEAGGSLPPLVLFNAADVFSGTRLVIGFPPLPPGLLGVDVSELTDLHPWYRVSLAEAVRLSANFPWGFEAGKLQRFPRVPAKLPKTMGDLPLLLRAEVDLHLPERHALGRDKNDTAVLVLDGGMVDNTGIDSLAQMIHRLAWWAGERPNQIPNLERAAAAFPHADQAQALTALTGLRQRAQAIMQTLRQRGVIIVEIDSGAKPGPPGSLTQSFPSAFEPLYAFNTIGYADGNSAKVKYDHFLREDLDMKFVAPPNGDHPPNARTPTKPSANYLRVALVCNHEENVMTAWALGAEDKARILARFLAEYVVHDGAEPETDPDLHRLKVAFGELLRQQERTTKAASEKAANFPAAQRKIDVKASERKQTYQSIR